MSDYKNARGGGGIKECGLYSDRWKVGNERGGGVVLRDRRHCGRGETGSDYK